MCQNVVASLCCKARTKFSHARTGSAYRDLVLDRACFLPVESTSAIESENVTGPMVRSVTGPMVRSVTGPMVRSALWFYTGETNARPVAESGLTTRFFFSTGSLLFPLVTLIT